MRNNVCLGNGWMDSLTKNQIKQKLNPALTVFWDTDKAILMKQHRRQKGGRYTRCQSQPWQKKINERRHSAASMFAELDKNTGCLWFPLSWSQERFNNRFHSVKLCPPSWQTFGVLTNCFYGDTVLGPTLLSTNSTWSFFEPRSRSGSRLWCERRLAPQPPAIICVLYCEGVNKSTTAPLSVPSVSEASALAFCCVIYARLLPKMSFLSPTAPSACERAWHLSVFINFKDAFACFCHSLCWFLINFTLVFFFLFPKSDALSLPPSLFLSGLDTYDVTCSFCLYPFPFSFVVTLLYKRISKGNILSRVTLYCTLDTGELRIYSVLRSFSSAYTSLRG